MPNIVILSLFFLCAVFDFLNGMRDASNFVSTAVTTRAISPRLALWLTAAAEFLGPFVLGTHVARTFSQDLLTPQSVSLDILLAAVGSAVAWNVITLALRLPSSSSHALFGGLIGAVLAGASLQAIYTATEIKILLSLFLSPVLGLVGGFLITRLVYWLASRATTRINTFFKGMQAFTAVALAMSYGGNDAQKSMGILALALTATGYFASFQVPWWVMALGSGFTALGIAIGGWRLIHTLGGKFYKIHPVHGFTSQVASIGVILSTALAGAPVSSSQVITTSIVGAGSADHIHRVRWGVVLHILSSWFLTIPICAGFGWLLYQILRLGM